MRDQQWLISYRDIDGVRLTLARMSRRVSRRPDLAAATHHLTDSRIELARVYLRLGSYEQAREAVGAVLKATPGHPWALAVLGQALVMQGQRDEGLSVLRRAEAARPRRPEAWLSLAEGFAAAKDPASATRCRQAAQALRAG